MLAADHLYNHAYLSVGHKGLFFERLDRGVSDESAAGSSSGPLAGYGSPVDTPRLVPFARGVYHNRNRTLIPGGGSPQLVGLAGVVPTGPPGNAWSSVALSQQGLSSGSAVAGRFMQADPNATALILGDQMAYFGTPQWPTMSSFDLKSRFGNGPGLHQYLGSKPWGLDDPSGLAWDPFEDMVDDYIAEDTAQKMAFAEAYGSYWKGVGKTALSFVPVVGSFMYGLELGERLASGDNLELMDYLAIGAHALPLAGSIGGKVGDAGFALMGKTRAALNRVRTQYALRGVRPKGELGQHYNKLVAAARACFTCLSPDTSVWTPAGPRPLATIQVGELVLTSNEQRDPVTDQEIPPYNHAQLTTELSRDTYRELRLLVARRDGSTTEIRQLKTSSELAKLGLADAKDSPEGLEIPLGNYMRLAEIGESERSLNGQLVQTSRDGWAQLVSVGPEVWLGGGIECPTAEAAPVMSMFVTTKATLWRIEFEGSKDTMQVTATHPLWSVSRDGWVNAMDIEIGEELAAYGVASKVRSKSISNTNSVVRNLSLSGGRTLFIGENKYLVHNMTCDLAAIMKDFGALTNGNSPGVKVVPSESELRTLFAKWSNGGSPVQSKTYQGNMVILNDGTRIGMRPKSTSGGATIDIFSDAGRKYKVHIK